MSAIKKQAAGVEPVPSAWEANILPINHACLVVTVNDSITFKKL